MVFNNYNFFHTPQTVHNLIIHYIYKRDKEEKLSKYQDVYNYVRVHLSAKYYKRLQADNEVWEHYKNFSDGYKRIRIAYIETARKRPEEFEKRLKNFIGKTKDNKMVKGFGGIEKYY